MTTYVELKAQAEKLLIQAEELRVKELNEAIQDIKQKIKLFGLSAQDLGLAVRANTSRSARRTQKPAVKGKVVKYRGPNGEVWSGGRGRKPKWVVAVLEAGQAIDKYKVD